MFIVLLLDKQLLDGQVSMSALSGDGDDDGLVSSAVGATEKECKEQGFIVTYVKSHWSEHVSTRKTTTK